MNKPKKELVLVSVIVPVYNVGKYVGKCLRSLLQQSYGRVEIIVVDDGSTDESGKICDDLAQNEPRMRVFHKKNGGLSSARNFGIAKARGEWLAFVDSDDYVRKNFISELYNAVLIEQAEVAVVGFDDIKPKKEAMSGKDAVVKLLVGQENIDIVTWNKIYKKSLFEGVKFPEGEKHEDSLTTYKILAKAEKVAYVPESLYVYRKREGSIMNEADEAERLETRERAAKEAIEYFADNGDLKDAAKVSLLLAKYAYIDAAVRGEIEKKYYSENMRWIKDNKNDFKNNKYMTKKLRLYNWLIGVGLYGAFRKVV